MGVLRVTPCRTNSSFSLLGPCICFLCANPIVVLPTGTLHVVGYSPYRATGFFLLSPNPTVWFSQQKNYMGELQGNRILSPLGPFGFCEGNRQIGLPMENPYAIHTAPLMSICSLNCVFTCTVGKFTFRVFFFFLEVPMSEVFSKVDTFPLACKSVYLPHLVPTCCFCCM